MALYNLISCRGFGDAVEKTTMQFGDCAGARLGLVALFFINALLRKWGGEKMGIEYNFWLGLAGAFLGYLITITFTGMVGLSMIIGIAGMILGGYFGGSLFGGDGEYEYE